MSLKIKQISSRKHAIRVKILYLHISLSSKIAGRRTTDSSGDRKHMFLARTSRFASMRTESSSCRMLIIKRGLNVNLYDVDDVDGSLPERVR